MDLFIKDSQHPTPSFEGKTLLLPVVSFGNVGQLAVETMITTLNGHRIGFLSLEDEVLPVAGNDPFSAPDAPVDGEIHVAVELFASSEPSASDIIIIQQRTPVNKDMRNEYVDKVLSWAKAAGFARLILLSSANAGWRKDVQMYGPQLRCIEKSMPADDIVLKRAKEVLHAPFASEEEEALFLGEKSITSLLLHACSTTHQIPTFCLLLFCNEGHNIPDALAMATYANTFMQIKEASASSPSPVFTEWTIPGSWRLLYGSSFDPSLFT